MVLSLFQSLVKNRMLVVFPFLEIC